MMNLFSCLEGLSLGASWLLGQTSAPSTSWPDVVRDMDVGKLVIMLIFGTGLVSAAGYAIATIVRAFNSTPDESEELREKIATLEKRIEQIERAG
jgi:hypothetical protein